jgi:hypothetical protein
MDLQELLKQLTDYTCLWCSCIIFRNWYLKELCSRVQLKKRRERDNTPGRVYEYPVATNIFSGRFYP